MKKSISRLHYITQDIAGFTHPQLVELACIGGANWVQLRVKNKQYDEWLKIALETKSICKKYGARLIINDNIQIAKEISADGVHLGKEDMSPNEARKILGNNFIIEGSSNTIEDVRRQMADGVDYVGIGPYHFTTTREKLNPILGLEGIQKIAKEFGSTIPMIAIGGIKPEDVESLMQTGIHGIAVSSGINMAENKSEMTKKFISSLKIKQPSISSTSCG